MVCNIKIIRINANSAPSRGVSDILSFTLRDIAAWLQCPNLFQTNLSNHLARGTYAHGYYAQIKLSLSDSKLNWVLCSEANADGAPSRSRTYDLSLRRGALYPAELSGHMICKQLSHAIPVNKTITLFILLFH